MPVTHGRGLGAEPLLIRVGRGSDSTLEEDMVLGIQSWVARDDVESAGSSTLTFYRIL
jgi:hypothetical protein